MSKKTQKTKMSLQELAAMRGVEKPAQEGCSYDAAYVQHEELSPTAGMSNKERREYMRAKEQREFQENRASEMAEKFGLELEIRGGIDCDYYSFHLFAMKDGVPFFACPTTLAAGEFIVPAECYEFSAYESAADFFSSAEVSSMPLKKASDLWLASRSVERDLVMSLADEMPDATVREAACVAADRQQESRARRNGALIQGGRDFSRLGDNPSQHAYKGGFGGHHD